MNVYVGNPLQTRGAEIYVLQGGRGSGMPFLYVRNGLGLEFWISLDRCGDVSRLQLGGTNMGYFSPCGYVAPAYYDGRGNGFLKSFTAGFFTTCGLTAVGSPCTDEGEELPLHGTVSHIPARLTALEEDESGLTVRLQMRDATLFGRKLVMAREYRVSYTANVLQVRDAVTNEGDAASPYMLLYHCNMGYPLLDETAVVRIPHDRMTPRNPHAAGQAAAALRMEPPQGGYEECCYYYDVTVQGGLAHAGIYNGRLGRGVVLAFDREQLPCFTEWKMMGRQDYVLGLEPGNCTPDGRDVLRRRGTLRFLQPGETGETGVTFRFVTEEKSFEEAFGC